MNRRLCSAKVINPLGALLGKTPSGFDLIRDGLLLLQAPTAESFAALSPKQHLPQAMLLFLFIILSLGEIDDSFSFFLCIPHRLIRSA